MAVVLGQVAYEPILPVRTLQGIGFPVASRFPEDATQTFMLGVPLRLVAGYIREASFVAADVIYGISSEKAHNFAAAGVGADQNQGAPQNQTSGLIIPPGVWPTDGNIGFYAASGNTIFSASLKVGQVFTQALIVPGTYYRLIKDATSGFWYVDNTLTGGNAGVVNLIGMDPSSPNTVAGGCRVWFQFIAAQRFFQ